MDETIAYYEANAAEYFAQTRDVDMSPLYEHFLPLLPPGGRILDAGCGSGRDTKAFLERGFRVTPMEASLRLAKLAADFTGCQVTVLRFEKIAFVSEFDGIWACASLLHVPSRELSATLSRLTTALVPGGHLYVSFKRGDNERNVGGRYFSDQTEQSLADLVSDVPDLSMVESWQTEDRRKDRAEEFWINAVLQRHLSPSRQ